MDLPNLTNYAEHPTEPDWLVFRFPVAAQREEFAQMLGAEGIRHEVDTDAGPPYLIGVRSRHRERAVRLNYTVLGRHRRPFLSDPLFRWSVLAAVGALLVLAFIGWLAGR